MSKEQLNVLIVDDEPNILNAFKRQLRNNFDLTTANGSIQALKLIESGKKFSVIISDMTMPEMNGVEFLKKVKEKSSETVRIMLTGNADQETAAKAVNKSGIFRFLTKPCSSEELTQAINDGFEQYKLITSEKELLNNTLRGSVKLLTDILSIVEPESFGNAMNYRMPIREIATVLGLSSSWDIELSMMLSDIGSILYPKEIRDKIDQGLTLNDAEQKLVESAPETAKNLIKNIPRLENVAAAVYYSNKNFDGSGFPYDAISGYEINQVARIIKVLKDFDINKKSLGDNYKAISKMYERQEFYTPEILEIAKDLFAPEKEETNKNNDTPSIFEVTLNQLCPEQVVLEDIFTNDGILLVKKGAVISETMIEKLKNYGSIAGLREPIMVDCLIPTE